MTQPRRVVVSFTLPSNCARWNWPIEGADAIDALVEILDRANIAWKVQDRDGYMWDEQGDLVEVREGMARP